MNPTDAPDLTPRYNIAPTQSITAVVADEERWREIRQLRWGLIPPWAKELGIGNRMINARGETVDSKPAFRSAFRCQRCLIPTDGYYEWRKQADGKQPYWIHPRAGGVVAMAGLWERNRKVTTDGTPVESCTIITTEANQTTGRVHDRMPVFIHAPDHAAWLDPTNQQTDSLESLLRPAPEDVFELTAVSRHVNNPRHEDASCLTQQPTLFED